MTKYRYLLVPLAVAALASCSGSPVEAPAIEPRLEGGGGCGTLAPAVSLEQAPSQADPARHQPIRFLVTFQLPVTGFDGDDLVFGGTAAAGATASVTSIDASHYVVEVSGLTRNGTVSASVRGGAAEANQFCNNLTAASTSVDNVVRFVGKSR